MVYLALYMADSILQLVSLYFKIAWLNYFTKVLLMPLLMLFILSSGIKDTRMKFVYSALFFSWLGDIFLIFPRAVYAEAAQKLLFLAGLISFLLAHVSFIIFFIKDISRIKKASLIVERPYLAVPFFIYLFVLLKLLNPYLSVMRWPVYFYGICITLMWMTAFNRIKLINTFSFGVVFAGATLFLVSDSFLAVNVFYKNLEWHAYVIMLTYMAAQGLIIYGISKRRKGQPGNYNSSSRMIFL